MAGRAIELRNVTYFYPNSDSPALEGVSLSIDYGEFVAIAGPSGGGKSTLCRIVTGLIPHIYGGSLTGEVIVDGVNIVEEGARGIVGRAGIVLQVPENQIINLVVEEEIAFPLENLLFDANLIVERVEETLNSLGIAHLRRRTTNTLSGGEVQKTVLASVLAYRPRILILDEPLAHLDPYSVRELLALLYKLNKVDGLTIVVVEHRLTELIKYISRLVLLDRRIIADGKPREVLQSMMETKNGRGVEIPPVTKFSYIVGLGFTPITIEESIELVKELLLRKDLCSNGPVYKVDGGQVGKESPVISIENLWYIYPGGRAALRDVNLNIYRGEFIAIVGANGSGKTTLVKHLNGLLKPSRGRVRVLGRDTYSCSVAELARHVGLVFQNPLHQFFNETVLEEVLFTARNMGVENAKSRALSILKHLNLHHLANRSPYEISVGEQRRLAIASILVYDPEIVVLDEATAGIDFSLKMELLKIIEELLKKGRTVILTTHDIEFITYAPIDRVVVLSDGEVVVQGEAREVLYNVELLTKARVSPPQIPTLINIAGVDMCTKPLNEEELYRLVQGI